MANLELAEKWRAEWALRVMADIALAEVWDTYHNRSTILDALDDDAWTRVREVIAGKVIHRSVEEHERALDILAEYDSLVGILDEVAE